MHVRFFIPNVKYNISSSVKSSELNKKMINLAKNELIVCQSLESRQKYFNYEPELHTDY
jgi:hypothetical protein